MREDAVYKKIEVVGTSSESLEAAIRNAIARASRTVHALRWFEVAEIRGAIAGDTVEQFQVTVRIGFKLDK
jgi:flavin-binding protein dodecin